jgi:hypothetical protein
MPTLSCEDSHILVRLVPKLSIEAVALALMNNAQLLERQFEL